jgi:hypothetical protein
VDDLPLSKSGCSILPIVRRYRAGVLRASGLYTAPRGRASPPVSSAAFALRGPSGDATMTTPGGAGTRSGKHPIPRARLTGFSHRAGAPVPQGPGPSLSPLRCRKASLCWSLQEGERPTDTPPHPPPSVERRDSSARCPVAQRDHGSKQGMLDALPIWTVFVRHVAISVGRCGLWRRPLLGTSVDSTQLFHRRFIAVCFDVNQGVGSLMASGRGAQ